MDAFYAPAEPAINGTATRTAIDTKKQAGMGGGQLAYIAYSL
jgi:hypothetical protein